MRRSLAVRVLAVSTLTLLGATSALPDAGADVAPGAARPAFAASAAGAGTRVLVGLDPAADPAVVAAGVGATVEGRVEGLGVVALTVAPAAADAVVAALSRRPGVAWAERDAVADGTLTPSDPSFANQWNMTRTRAPELWDASTGSAGVVVAVLDTGWTPGLADGPVRVEPGPDLVNGDADPTDDHGHGTYMTGMISAPGGNGVGVAGWCWSCTIMPVKVLNASNQGSYAAIAQGIVWAADNGADVINLSLGGTTPSATLDSAVAHARARGAVVVVAAGNSASTTPTYPANSPGAIAVAGSDLHDARTSTTNHGPWVDLAAPANNPTTWRDGGFRSVGGSSAAAAMVSGAAATLRAARPAATGAQVEQALVGGAVPVSGGWVSAGRLDAAASLARLGGSTTSTTATTVVATTSTTAPATTTTTAPSGGGGGGRKPGKPGKR